MRVETTRLVRALTAAALAFGVLAAAPPPRKPVIFEAPARNVPAGPLGDDPFARVLPSGRLLQPAGTSVVTGMNALGVAIAPGGRYAVVSNDDERESDAVSMLDPLTRGGYSLAVVDLGTMTVVDRYRNADEGFWQGVLAVRDPLDPAATLVLASGGAKDVVFAFDLDPAGHLRADTVRHTIPIPVPLDERFANAYHGFPGSIVAAPGGLHAYVVGNLANNVTTLDLRTRAVAGPAAQVGFYPLGAAALADGALVANEGLYLPSVLAAPAAAPPFGVAPADPRASSLSLLTADASGNLQAPVATVPLDPQPDGVRVVGGAHPDAVVAMHSRPFAFVAMANVDRIATVQLPAAGESPVPHVVGGTELRLFDRGPYGTQPTALALSPDEKRLYVALAGINAVAVLDATDPRRLHRLGLLPTGWWPSALALSANGRFLYVANAKGLAHDPGFQGAGPEVTNGRGQVQAVSQDSNAVWSTLQRIDLAATDLRVTTPRTLANQRATRPLVRSAVVPQTLGRAVRTPIAHVVEILEENKTYDAMLGDLTDAAGQPHGPGDPSLVAFDASVTPNLHALARTFGVAGNLFADAEESDAGHQFVAGGIASDFTERTLLDKSGRRPLVNKNEDVEDYPRAGYIFNSLARRGLPFRDYGDLVRVNGYDEGQATDPKTDDPPFIDVADQTARTQGLGGRYALDAPALAALAGHVDLDYPGWNLRIRDVRRAAEFIRDFDPLVRAGQMPAYTYIWLPADHGGAGKNIPPLPEEVADGDRALGTIVAYLSHLPQWSSTAIFIEPDDAQSSRDHVDEHRSYAVIVSPFAKRRYVGMRHQSTVSVLKTQEELLGLPALSLGDALATDLRDFFTAVPDPAPFDAIPVPTQTASAEGARIGALLERTDLHAPDADGPRVARLIDLSRQADALAARRAGLSPAAYAAAQRALGDAARAVVAEAKRRERE